MHRNSFLCSPHLLNSDQSLRKNQNIFFAGQITGVEGYMESAMSGIWAGINAARRMQGKPMVTPPPDTMAGALLRYISDPEVKDFQPMGANFGILPPLEHPIRDKKARYEALAQRAIEHFEQMMEREL